MNADDRPADPPTACRALVRYGPGGPTIRHLDDDLEAGPETLEFVRAVIADRYGETPYGPHEASVHLVGDVLVVHRPEGPDRGVVATFDREAESRSVASLLETLAGV